MSTENSTVVEILAIGREILDGRVVDTNSVWLAQQLKGRGLIPRYAQKVDDEIDRVVEAFAIARKRSGIVLVTGGLGPTDDDLTAQAFSKFIGEPLELNALAFSQVEAWFKKMQRPLLDVQKKQAYFPPSCQILENSVGTAPGFSKKFDNGGAGQLWYFMPGVPKEMHQIFLDHVIADLPSVAGYRSSSWATQFTSEGELQSRLKSVHARLPKHFEITYRTRFPENHIGLHGVCESEGDRNLYEALAGELSKTLGIDAFSGGLNRELKSLEEELLEKLKLGSYSLASVESCTGGLVASRVTDVPGSSEVFWASWIVYDNRAKVAIGVDPKLLEKHGAVSAEVASALAERGLAQLEKLGAKNPICVSTTGIAGPGGATPDKPVGLCFVAVAKSGMKTRVEEVRGRAQLKRSENKLLFSQKALDLVRQVLGAL